ncbi:oligosaccharide flippase family protein [Candidatus Pacearchaeota archaeon]|nr:oligosaccharide flippase family protein [Candidatus Pacearchaeota archaeon]
MLNRLFSRIIKIDAIQRQSILLIISQILITFIGFVSTVYFAKVLGAGELGSYFLFVTYFGLISTFVDLGFGMAAIKKISEKNKANEYFSAFVIIKISLITTLIVLLLIFRNYFFALNTHGTFIWLIIALIVSILSGITNNSIAGLGKVGIIATTLSIDNLSRIIIQVIAVYLGYSLFGMLGGFVAGLSLGALVQLRFLDLKLVKFKWKHVKSLANFSVWSFIVTGSVATFQSVDTILIGHYMQNSDIGIYRIVLQLSGMLFIIASSLSSSLYPRISRWGVTGEISLIEKSLSRGITYSLLITIPFVAGGILLGDRILYHLYGTDFASGYITFVILLFSQVANIFHSFFITYISALDKLKKSFKFMFVSVIVNIILNLILIPIFGISGAAIATVITLSLNAYMAKHLLSKTIKIRLEDSVWYILKATIIMSLFIGVYRLTIPISKFWLILIPVVLGGLIYIILIFKFDSKIYDELKGIIKNMNNA